MRTARTLTLIATIVSCHSPTERVTLSKEALLDDDASTSTPEHRENEQTVPSSTPSGVPPAPPPAPSRALNHWMLAYVGRDTYQLRRDPRFDDWHRRHFSHKGSIYAWDFSTALRVVTDVPSTVLEPLPGVVVFDGCRLHECPSRAVVVYDTARDIALAQFALNFRPNDPTLYRDYQTHILASTTRCSLVPARLLQIIEAWNWRSVLNYDWGPRRCAWYEEPDHRTCQGLQERLPVKYRPPEGGAREFAQRFPTVGTLKEFLDRCDPMGGAG